MLVLVWSAKGGSGVTVVAAALAVLSAAQTPTVLVDIGGDAHAALGLADPAGPGVLDWLQSPAATADGLFRLGTAARDHLRVVGPGSAGEALDDAAWERVATACASRRDVVIVDTGNGVPPPAAHRLARRSLLVTRSCFLALRRAVPYAGLASDAVLVTEPGRALGAADVERALAVAVTAEVAWDPAVGRAVDAGLLCSRLPAGLSRQLRHVAPSVTA